jgi:hypothetical protein
MAELHKLTVDQGATYQESVEWTDPSGVPINITGYTARMNIARTYSDQVPILSLTSPSGGLVVTGAAGRIDITIASDETDGMDGAYVYDLDVESPQGVVDRLIQGVIEINKRVPQP